MDANKTYMMLWKVTYEMRPRDSNEEFKHVTLDIVTDVISDAFDTARVQAHKLGLETRFPISIQLVSP